jgi:hypothetical protein
MSDKRAQNNTNSKPPEDLNITVPGVVKVVGWDEQDEWFSWFAMGPIEFFEIIDMGRLLEELKTLWLGGLFPELSKAYVSLKAVRQAGENTELSAMHRDCDAVINHCWVAYKEFLQKIAKTLDYDIGFFYKDDNKFKDESEAMKQRRPELVDLIDWVTEMRNDFLNELNSLRREQQHPKRARSSSDQQYNPTMMENVFQGTCWTIENILMALISTRLPKGLMVIAVEEPDKKEGCHRRYRLAIPQESIKK